MKYVPHALVATVAALLILYAVGVISGAVLFRGVLGCFATFVLLAVTMLWITQRRPPRPLPKPWSDRFIIGTAGEDLHEGDIVKLDADGRIRKPRPPVSPSEKVQ